MLLLLLLFYILELKKKLFNTEEFIIINQTVNNFINRFSVSDYPPTDQNIIEDWLKNAIQNINFATLIETIKMTDFERTSKFKLFNIVENSKLNKENIYSAMVDLRTVLISIKISDSNEGRALEGRQKQMDKEEEKEESFLDIDDWVSKLLPEDKREYGLSDADDDTALLKFINERCTQVLYIYVYIYIFMTIQIFISLL